MLHVLRLSSRNYPVISIEIRGQNGQRSLRDISNSPIFLRLGSRLRGPKETTKVSALRRVIISAVVVYNADPKYASITSGIRVT